MGAETAVAVAADVVATATIAATTATNVVADIVAVDFVAAAAAADAASFVYVCAS